MERTRIRRSAAALLLIIAQAAPLGAVGEYSLYFGAPGGTVEVDLLELPPDAEALTVEVWIQTVAPVRQPTCVVSMWSDEPKAVDRGVFYLELRSSNRIAFGLCNREGQRESLQARGWRDGCWHHVSASWNGLAMVIHVDGEEVGRREVAGFGPLAASTLPLVIGAAETRGRAVSPFEGFLAEVRIWTVAREPEAIRASLEAPVAGDEPNLLVCFPLREKAPTEEVADRAASGLVGWLSPALARSGWCHTIPWDDPEPGRPHLDLFCHVFPAQSPAIVRPEWRKILVTHERAQRVGILWQDASTRVIRISWFDPATAECETCELEGRPDGILAAGTTDPLGNVYYLVIQESPRDRSEEVALIVNLRKASATGESLRVEKLDASRSGLNLYSYTNRGGGPASLRCGKGTLGLILPRTMYMSGDGLRHQGAIALAFSTKDLKLLKHLGTTSSHSKGNILTVDSQGEFLGLDLGDNYPRGLHLHRFSSSGKTSRVVFTYKTAHATSPRNSQEVYEEISGDGRTFYKWSNDNATYTELGGIVESRQGYVVVFSTDRSPEGKVLDNSRAFRECGDPRNLALLRVVRDFQKGSRGSVVGDAIMVDPSRGSAAETGGFYDFGGRWAEQRVTGVNWLTDYAAGESARAPQLIPLADDFLVLWERAHPGGSALQAMRIDARGEVQIPPFRIELDLELSRRGCVLGLGERLYLLASDRRSKRTCLYSFRAAPE